MTGDNSVFTSSIGSMSDINYSESGNFHKSEKIGNLFKLYNLGGLRDEQLEELVLTESNIDLNSTVSIEKINKNYIEALNMYSEVFLIDLKAPFTKINFKTKKDVFNFLKKTSNILKSDLRQIYCDLVKLTFGFDFIDSHREMAEAEKDTNDFVDEYYLHDKLPSVGKFTLSIPDIMEKVPGEDYRKTSGYYDKKLPNGSVKRIPCSLKFRGKSREKILIKILASEKGNTKISELCNDNIGTELESVDIDNTIYMLEYKYFIVKEAGIIEQSDFRQKFGFFSEDDIKKFQSDKILRGEFREYLSELPKSVRKKNSSQKYQDCKFQFYAEFPDGRRNGVEERVVKAGNKNQSGFSSSKIVDGLKVIDAFIGLRGWISKSYIERHSKRIAGMDGIEKSATDISNFFMSQLLRLQVPGFERRNIYSSPGKLEEIVKNAHAYPDFIVGAIRKHLKLNSKVKASEIIEGVKSGAIRIVKS